MGDQISRRFTLDLSPEEYSELARLAAQRKVSKRDILRRSLRIFFLLAKAPADAEIVIRSGDKETHLFLL